jgi:dTDP-4-amino-4,6-dideoxygalactose transaminase
VPRVRSEASSAYALYTIRVADRDAVKAKIDAAGVGTGLFYRLALHQHPAFRGVQARALPVSEQLANEVISLPIHPDLGEDEVDRVIAAVIAAVA